MIRFRRHSAMALAAIVATIGSFGLASPGGYWLLIPLAPLSLAIYLWMAGTDANDYGLRRRFHLRHRIIPWTEVSALIPRQPDKVFVALESGKVLPLPAVKPEDLTRLVSASGSTVLTRDGVTQ